MVYTVCKGKRNLQTKEYNIFENYNLTPLDMYTGLSQVYCIKSEGRIHLYTKFVLEIITCDPSMYTMDHTDLIPLVHKWNPKFFLSILSKIS